ncbi:IPExxxVDY family protein [Maribacter sp. 2308TA10-17]|uniref:IPExxxVDY family protein n=1 Tax=Maribacter sp. 2308TA10-17 TaxID=3386276 RepID=UPI0039BCBADA
MMAIHKITDDFYEDSFTLLALHSSMEDYALVYALNLCLKSNFKRSSKDLDISEHISFPIFEWRDNSNDSYWTLITNTSLQEENTVRTDLFMNEPSFTKHQLVPEHKDADYLLKIEHDDDSIEGKTVKKLLTIPKIITAYVLDVDHLKSKNNLIF